MLVLQHERRNEMSPGPWKEEWNVPRTVQTCCLGPGKFLSPVLISVRRLCRAGPGVPPVIWGQPGTATSRCCSPSKHKAQLGVSGIHAGSAEVSSRGVVEPRSFGKGCLVFQGVLQLEVTPWQAGRLHCSAASRTLEFWAPWWLWQHRHCWRRLGLQEEQSIIATLKHFFYNWLAPL